MSFEKETLVSMKIHECVPQTPGPPRHRALFIPATKFLSHVLAPLPAIQRPIRRDRGTWLHNTKLENPLNLHDTMAKEKKTRMNLYR
jgi:hypothetical protein